MINYLVLVLTHRMHVFEDCRYWCVHLRCLSRRCRWWRWRQSLWGERVWIEVEKVVEAMAGLLVVVERWAEVRMAAVTEGALPGLAA